MLKSSMMKKKIPYKMQLKRSQLKCKQKTSKDSTQSIHITECSHKCLHLSNKMTQGQAIMWKSLSVLQDQTLIFPQLVVGSGPQSLHFDLELSSRLEKA